MYPPPLFFYLNQSSEERHCLLHKIATLFDEKKDEIEAFFIEKSQGIIPPLYLSCDIRNSGHKLGVIDCNLFPAGFNNLCNSFSEQTTQALKGYFDKYFPGKNKIILLIEEHTRNRFYLENILKLQSFFEKIGKEIRLSYPGLDLKPDQMTVPLDSDHTLHLEKLRTENGVPQLMSFEADIVVSNNDFSGGIPEKIIPILDKIIPSPQLGWHQRKKSSHFKHLNNILHDFCALLEIDPWLFSCKFGSVSDVDLSSESDLKLIYEEMNLVMSEIQEKYQKYGIDDSPYFFLKNDSGTYGMGLMAIQDPEEVLQLNRRNRNKLLSAKGGNITSSFLIQEGIPTADFYSGYPIEPVIYMVGLEPVGGFFRMNPHRDSQSSLNARGMIFSCLCLHKIDEPHEESFLNCEEKEALVQISRVLARIDALAAAQEAKELPIPSDH